jgi:predicted hydrolase (HD superfamily)
MGIKRQIREEVVKLFPLDSAVRRRLYCTSKWIFPNHIDPMIDISNELCDKYGGDKEICEIACLLHDTGLVYKRVGKNPLGHEENSLEFANKILTKYGVDEEMITAILNCIKATKLDYIVKSTNEKIVRSADILSQFYSMHFLAKAHFYESWDLYLNFFEKKIVKGFDKICFEEEQKKVEPIRDYYLKIYENYKKYNFLG